jgi:hypothetical protein
MSHGSILIGRDFDKSLASEQFSMSGYPKGPARVLRKRTAVAALIV